QPDQPGHYVVKLRLTGDHPLDCRVDLDLVTNAADARKQAPDDPYRWAECIGGHPNPVNNPGALPFDLSPPSVTLIDSTLSLDIALTPRQDEEVRGWFTLAPPGSSQPWNEAVYQSPVQQKLVPGNEPAAFEWQVPLGADVAPGVYGLTVWFHRRGETDWEHAAGGDIDVAPIVVDEDRSVRWAGPIRIQLARPTGALPAGRSSHLELTVSGVSNRQSCTSSWRLFSGPDVVASGNGGRCNKPEIAIPATVVPGQYRLQIDAYSEREDAFRLSDALSVPIAVIQPAPAGSET
ncbi:MAG TPA: hypothetical protein VK356_01795, partial [Thermomicrobiales bacterium]|nr:hypothetical protein [Thermomicrobiales bacterium]